MKKSVKKVLAALLSVLLFASLFTTTAFAAHPFAFDEDVAAAKDQLNKAVDDLYATKIIVGGDMGKLTALINTTYLVVGKGITNGYTVLAYQAMTDHVKEFQGKLETCRDNMVQNIADWTANVFANLDFTIVG